MNASFLVRNKTFSSADRFDSACLEFVVILEASEEFLHRRVMNLPERAVAGTHNTESEFQRRVKTVTDLGDDGQAAKFFEDVDRPGEIFSKFREGKRLER